MARSFAVRGIVEGFYGTPWTHRARLDTIAFLAPHGMNAYAYAPKDDPRHRAAWREPYDAAELGRFRELAGHADAHGVRFGFAISPGLDIDYTDPTDRSALLAKLAPLREAGVSWFLLLVDDIPPRPGLGPLQAGLGTWLRAELGDARLTVCPTEYVGTRPSPYLAELAGGLPADVDLMWTGPTVCSPTITADDARGWVDAVGGHGVVVWDNYPVNDAFMTRALHLGPYRGRDPHLADLVGGVLCNPMTQAYASHIALATAMAFLTDPDEYDPDAAWERAIAEIGGIRAPALRALGRACADGPVAPPEAIPLAGLVTRLRDALAGDDWEEPLVAVDAELRAAAAAPGDLAAEPADDGDPEGGLATEVAPWAAAAAAEAAAGIAATKLIAMCGPPASPATTDPERALHRAIGVLARWQAIRADEYTVFGPRFAVYTPIVQLPGGGPALDAAAAVREDANAIDALCRLALGVYDAWRGRGDTGAGA